MIDWDLYDAHLNAQGYTRRERIINQTKRSINKRAVRSPAYKTVLIDGEEQDVVITSRAELYQKKINAMPGENIYAGSIVEWNNVCWIITETDCEDEIYQRGVMYKCNTFLRWQNERGEIIERYGYSQDITEFAAGVVENKILNSIQFNVKIMLPMDSETVKLRRNKRFLLDVISDKPNAYILTNRNVITQNYLPEPVDSEQPFNGKGKVIMLTLSQTALSDRDNTELMIADYFEPEAVVTPTNVTCKISYTGKPEIKSGGSFKKFSAVFYDTDGNEVTGVTPIWQVIVPPQFEKCFTVEYVGNDIKIKALDKPEAVGSEIKIVLQSNDGIYSSELYVKVVYLYS